MGYTTVPTALINPSPFKLAQVCFSAQKLLAFLTASAEV